MEKNYFITIVAFLLAIGIKAQPVITYNGNAPQIGDEYNLSGVFGTFDPGPAGGNQSWDFSDIQPTISASSTVVDASSTPFADDFPEATIAYVNIPADNSYSYHQLTTSEMFYVGLGTDFGLPTEDINHFPDPRKEMQYPFSYNDVYTDTYLFIFPSDLMLIHERGTITATADAWGSVKTPAGTYNSTLRIREEEVYTDSVWNADGVLMSVTTHTETNYEWFTADSHYPVLDIMITEAGSSLSYSTSANGIEDNPLLSQINIYPNPATDRINIELPEGITGNTEIYIFNLTGQRMLQLEKSGNRHFTADISRLSTGVYFLKIKCKQGDYISRSFIKQ